MNEPLSRRDFLKIMAVALPTGFFVGTSIGRWIAREYGEEVVEKIVRMKLSPEERRMISEVSDFREKIGLDGLPSELIPRIIDDAEWLDPAEFIDFLPEKNRSYSMMLADVIKGLFGDNITNNVRGARSSFDFPYGMSFNHVDRFCNIAENIHLIDIHDFIDFILHEACGHGTDPGAGASYHAEVLIRVEYGKWRALSKAFSIPEQFLNHPNDATFPLLKKKIGEVVGRSIIENNGVIEVDDVVTVRRKMHELALKKGKKRFDLLKFNKSTCNEVGEVLIDLLLKEEIKFIGELKTTYQEGLEVALLEIYAEMFKYAFKYPGKINNDVDIVSGIMEVVSAISGKTTNIDELRENVLSPSQEVLERNFNEIEAITAAKKRESVFTEVVQAFAPETSEVIVDQEELVSQKKEFQSFEDTLAFFQDKGIIPATMNVPSNFREDFNKFGFFYSEIIKKYPTLKDTTAQQYDELFDPELHIWEIREIEGAMDSGFVRRFLALNEVSIDNAKIIVEKSLVLEKFVNSPVF